mmetsp:Transcript_26942/g.67867  ORF Transcript_26942/g.67867 Transcript_26942/m.67867 type:complete len:285 (-) Transcript_26942:1257-2111(-)
MVDADLPLPLADDAALLDLPPFAAPVVADDVPFPFPAAAETEAPSLLFKSCKLSLMVSPSRSSSSFKMADSSAGKTTSGCFGSSTGTDLSASIASSPCGSGSASFASASPSTTAGAAIPPNENDSRVEYFFSGTIFSSNTSSSFARGSCSEQPFFSTFSPTTRGPAAATAAPFNSSSREPEPAGAISTSRSSSANTLASTAGGAAAADSTPCSSTSSIATSSLVSGCTGAALLSASGATGTLFSTSTCWTASSAESDDFSITSAFAVSAGTKEPFSVPSASTSS